MEAVVNGFEGFACDVLPELAATLNGDHKILAFLRENVRFW